MTVFAKFGSPLHTRKVSTPKQIKALDIKKLRSRHIQKNQGLGEQEKGHREQKGSESGGQQLSRKQGARAFHKNKKGLGLRV